MRVGNRLSEDKIEDFIGQRTIIVGDVNTGKTLCMLRILKAFVKKKCASIAVIDLAPHVTGGIGGKMEKISDGDIVYLTTDIVAPRLTGRSEGEIHDLAARNAAAIDKLFDGYLNDPRRILFINDATLYLHAGNLARLIEVINSAETLVVNAYRGATFSDSELSRRERGLLGDIMKICDNVIQLPVASL